MDIEKNRDNSTPFQNGAEPFRFFDGGSSAALLSEVMAALREQVGIITLIGGEGSGKSVLCRMLVKELTGSERVVLLPRAMRSFEEIVREVARACELESLAEADEGDTKKIFMDLVSAMRMRGESLILVCDEAEKMYLATFERIRKALDEVNRQGGGLQLLFAGRRRLAGYFEQLHLVDFGEVPERQLVFPEYDGEELLAYLNFHVQPPEGLGPREMFTQEAADIIATLSAGNLRMANRLAGEALQAAKSDMSSMVFPKHVQGGAPLQKRSSQAAKAGPRWPVAGKSLIYLGGGLVALLLLLLVFVFRGGDDEPLVHDGQQPAKDAAVTSLEKKVEKAVDKNSVAVREQPVKKEEKEAGQAAPVEAEPEILTATKAERAETKSGEDLVPAPAPEEVVSPQEEVVEEETVSVAEPTPQQHTPVAIAPVEIVEERSKTIEVVELTGPSKVVKDEGKQIHPESVKLVHGQSSVAPPAPVLPLLVPLMEAGEKWQAGEHRESYTIQLMALVSDQAEENLEKILTQSDYQEVGEKLVMLRRPSDPPVILVFYGVYPSMAAARNARNNMPIFLRKHHPYALSIKRAVEKGRLE